MSARNPLRPDLDPDEQYDLAKWFAHHPDVPANRARIGTYTTRIVATTPEIDPDEEPYGDVGGWQPEEARETLASMTIVAVGSIVVLLALAYAAGVIIRAAWPHS